MHSVHRLLDWTSTCAQQHTAVGIVVNLGCSPSVPQHLSGKGAGILLHATEMGKIQGSVSQELSCWQQPAPERLLQAVNWLHGAAQNQNCSAYSRILAQWSEFLAVRCSRHHADLHREALPLLGSSAALHLKCLELQPG